MSKASNSAVATPKAAPKTKAEAPKKSQPKKPVEAKDRPLTAKALKLLVALSEAKDGTLGKKELETVTNLTSADTSSFMGSIAPGKRYGKEWEEKPTHAYWDHIAASPNRPDWNHISLLGRGFVTFKKEKGSRAVFTITTEGRAYLKKVETEEAAAKAAAKAK